MVALIQKEIKNRREAIEEAKKANRPDLIEENEAEIKVLEVFLPKACILYTSDAADERSSVDLGGRRIIKKKKYEHVIATRRNTIRKNIRTTKK